MKNVLTGAFGVAALLCLSPIAQAAEGCNVLTALPVTISQPGKYCLSQNFTTAITSGTLINIAANDVTLDCQKFTLRSTATSNTGSSSAIVAMGRNNIVIENCSVVGGFTYGINVSQVNSQPTQSYYNTIRNNYVAGPYYQGIIAFGSAIEVTGNRVYDIGGQLNQLAIGIRVGGSTAGGPKFQVIRHNGVIGTNSPASRAYGIYSDYSIGALINENLISGTASAPGQLSYGVRISQGVGNTITGNNILDNGSGQSVGVSTPASGGWCYDNLLRVGTNTQGCDATYGND